MTKQIEIEEEPEVAERNFELISASAEESETADEFIVELQLETFNGASAHTLRLTEDEARDLLIELTVALQAIDAAKV